MPTNSSKSEFSPSLNASMQKLDPFAGTGPMLIQIPLTCFSNFSGPLSPYSFPTSTSEILPNSKPIN